MTEHIKIGDVSPRAQYTADGVQTSFTYPFPIFEDGDLKVWLDTSEQISGFSVEGAGQSGGGSVDFDSAPADGALVTLQRVVPIERTTDFQEGGAFRAKTINDELDRQTAMIQQIADDLSRTLTPPPTDPTSGLELPSVSARAGRFLGFDDNGTPVALTGVPTVLEGSGAPDQGLGGDGDAYLDTANAHLYGPKSGGSWGAPIDLRRDWIAASGAPDDGNDGEDGDVYFRADTGEIYGPKSSGAWGAAVADLSGPAGAAGADGSDGADGADGDFVHGSTPAGTVASADTFGFFDSDDGDAAKIGDVADLLSLAGGITRLSAQTLSGSGVSFTGIPAGADRVTILIESASLDGSDNLLVQIGDSGGLETTGYISTTTEGAGTGDASSTSGFVLRAGSSSRLITGRIVLERIDGNHWLSNHQVIYEASDTIDGAGRKELSGELTQLYITRTGSDDFDGGQVAVLVE